MSGCNSFLQQRIALCLAPTLPLRIALALIRRGSSPPPPDLKKGGSVESAWAIGSGNTPPPTPPSCIRTCPRFLKFFRINSLPQRATVGYEDGILIYPGKASEN